MKLRADHIQLIDMLADLDDGRSRVEKSEAAGFAKTYVYQLLKNSEFLAALRERTDEELGAGRSEVLGSVKRKALSGDMKGAELYLKATGDIQGGLNVTTNVTQNSDQNEDFAARLRGRFDARKLASERCRPIPTDED